jgi:hypothetical protein
MSHPPIDRDDDSPPLIIPLGMNLGSLSFLFAVAQSLSSGRGIGAGAGPRLCPHCGRHHPPESFDHDASNNEYEISGRQFADLLAQTFFAAEREKPLGSHPTAPLIIDSFKRSAFMAPKGPGKIAPDCTVCLETLVDKDDVCELPCRHLFHHACILPWLREHNACPTCRYPLLTDDAAYNASTVKPAQAAFDRAHADARNRTMEQIRRGETPAAFTGRCIKSVMSGHACQITCPPEPMPSSASASASAAAASTTLPITVELPVDEPCGTMIRLGCCTHLWHKPCLIQEQRVLRAANHGHLSLDGDTNEEIFICPACQKTSASFTTIQPPSLSPPATATATATATPTPTA